MARKPRKHSISQVYHIIFKGVDGKDIFYEEKDRIYFCDKLLETKNEYEMKIYSYCLMSNHIHLVIKIQDKILSSAMKSLGIKYVFYFNKKYFRTGPLFQNRFNSKCVENQKYFLDVCRYVEQNPEKAGICCTQKYKWSSYHEYIGNNIIVDKQDLLYYYHDSIEEYKSNTLKMKRENQLEFFEYELRDKMTDDELGFLIIKELNLKSINDFSKLPKEELKKGIEILKDLKYTSFNQISRVLRISRYQLRKYWK